MYMHTYAHQLITAGRTFANLLLRLLGGKKMGLTDRLLEELERRPSSTHGSEVVRPSAFQEDAAACLCGTNK